jgi:HSP20 family protein
MFWRGIGGPAFAGSISELGRLQDEMNQLFRSARGRYGTPDYPAVNAWVNENNVVLTAELPGIEPEDLEINVVEDTITIKGNRSETEIGETSEFHRRERGAGAFSRSFTLPYRVDGEKVEAECEKGILRVKLPRADSDKPRKIKVTRS